MEPSGYSAPVRLPLAKTIFLTIPIEASVLDDDVVVAEFELPASCRETVRDAARRVSSLNITGTTKISPLSSPDFVWPAGVSIMAVTDNQYLINYVK